MNSDQVIALVIALFGGAGAAIVTGLITRPKTRAEAGVAVATGQVTISGDAREWAKTFAERAQRAEDRVEKVEAEMYALERRFDLLLGYTQSLQREMVKVGGHPPRPPQELIPPLY